MSTTTRLLVGLWGVVGSAAALAQDAPPPPGGAGDPTIIAEDEAPTAPDPGADGQVEDRPSPRRPSGQGGGGGGGAGGGGRGGRGIALTEDGRSRLHLRLDAGAGFNTNPYASPLSGTEFNGDVITRIRPGVEVVYPGSLIAFNGGLSLDYGFLPGVVTSQTQNFLLFQGGANAGIEVNRGGMFTFALANDFTWANDPGLVAVGTTFNRLNNQLMAGVGFRPGGGTLNFRLNYQFGFEKWLDFDPFNVTPGVNRLVDAGAFDQMRHIGTLRADWRFLPRTGAFLAVTGGVNTFPFADINPTSFPVGVNVGLMGQITSKLSGLASIGYQNPLVLDTNAAGDLGITTATVIGVSGQAELRWAIGPTIQLSGGFQRNFSPAILYEFLTNNRVYLAYNQQIGGNLLFNVNVGYSLLQFGAEQTVNGELFTDVPLARLDGDLGGAANLRYQLFEWLGFGLTYRVNWRHTNANDAATGDNLSFLMNEILAVASLRY